MKLRLVGLLVTACTPAVVPGPDAASPSEAGAPDSALDASADGASPSECVLACAAMAAAGCSEGLASACVGTCMHIEQAHLIAFDVACLANARSPDHVRACGASCTTAR